jgi:hypothetical protein
MKLRPSFIALIAAAAIGGPALAGPAVGSGSIDFSFNSFSGPYNLWAGAVGDTSHLGWVSTVNGVVPTYDSSAPQVAGNVYGSAAVSGTSVNFNEGVGFAPNIVSFAATPTFSNLAQGQAFDLGTFTFVNGSWFGGNPDTSLNVPTLIGYTITTHSATAEFNQVLTGVLKVTTNYNTDCSTAAGQADGADFISIAGQPQLGSLRVYDAGACSGGNPSTGSIDLIMAFNSLDYVALANPVGGFFVPNDAVGPIGGGAVPEPASWALMISGFGLAGAALRRRRTAVAAPGPLRRAG